MADDFSLLFKGIAGLAVTYGLNLNMLQFSVIWLLCNMENKIISVERILQYTSIPSEPPLALKSSRTGSNWPWQGEVDIRNLQVFYNYVLTTPSSMRDAYINLMVPDNGCRFNIPHTCHLYYEALHALSMEE